MTYEIQIKEMSHLGWLPALLVPDIITDEWLEEFEKFVEDYGIKNITLEHRREFLGNGRFQDSYKLYVLNDVIDLSDNFSKNLYILYNANNISQLGSCLSDYCRSRQFI